MRRMRLRGKQMLIALFAAQLGLGCVAASFWGYFNSARSAYAALFGAGIAIVPGCFFALRVMPRQAQPDARAMGRAMVVGELGKLGLTAGLFTLAALTLGEQFVALITTYAACLGCYWLALILHR